MTTDMAPPPPRNLPAATSEIPFLIEPQTKSEPSTSSSSMAPPPPKNPNLPKSESVETQPNIYQDPAPQDESEGVDVAAVNSMSNQSIDIRPEHRPSVAVPYTIPEWSGPPSHHYLLEVLKEGSIIDQLDVYEKGAYMFGRVDLCDFILEHSTISRFHAVLQFKRSGVAYLYDLGSTHGTFVNKNQVKQKVYVELHVGDVIRFGQSTRLYILQGPSELMPPESDLKSIKKARMREDVEDMEASLLRAKLEALCADGISWGMGEDAIEEIEDDADEITWQTYKGQLTEKQEKTREKVIKRLEKIAHMKKEIDAIRAKDISQGGLTQGQQTQIARNEQRMAQIMEELENLEETLNESIRESLGARAGRMSYGKKKGATEDDEEYMSEEDEFYDRTKKQTSNRKGGENQSIETAETLLDKKDAIFKEMEEKKKLLSEENDRMVSENQGVEVAGDELDAYMSGLSSQLVHEKDEKLQKELSTLQAELDRILYLLKIADPTGEAAEKRESKSRDIERHASNAFKSSSVMQTSSKQSTRPRPEKSSSSSDQKQVTTETKIELGKKEASGEAIDKTEGKTIYSVAKPQWLGAVEHMETKETKQEAPQDMDESDQFVDYKDRKNVLKNQDPPKDDVVSGIENAAPGLILRKRKRVEKTNTVESKASEEPTLSSVGAEFKAEDAIALLLKHKKGYYASEDGEGHEDEDTPRDSNSGKESKMPKRVLGPERPSFLKSERDYESWVPPEGQSGDGRTSLNDRFGY